MLVLKRFMTQDGSFQELPTYVKKSPPKFGPFMALVCIVVLALIGSAGYYFIGMSKSEASKASPVPNTPKPTVVISPTTSASVSGMVTPTTKATKVTPTSAQEMDRSKLRITVLNGSGVAGAAKGISVDLTDVGYTIASISNAEEYTYTGVTVKITKAKSEYLSLLQKDIKASMPDVVVTTKIDDKIETDAEVIVGK